MAWKAEEKSGMSRQSHLFFFSRRSDGCAVKAAAEFVERVQDPGTLYPLRVLGDAH